MKYYAVRRGRKIGVFTSWDKCKEQVNGYENASFKSFATREEAEAFILHKKIFTKCPKMCAYVDGSFNAHKKVYGYGVVMVHENKVLEKFHGSGNDKDYIEMRNVAGEIAGSLAAVERAIAHGCMELTIYYDYAGIEKWATGEWKANKKGTKFYARKMKEFSSRIRIAFVKVQAHTGVKYNELADRLAKKGALVK